MTEIQLTQDQVTKISDEDYAVISAHRWYAALTVRGEYVAGSWISGRNVDMSRYLLSAPPELTVDHIDGDKLNNQRSNIRLATNAQNCWNGGKKLRRGKASSKYKGVSYHSRDYVWQANIRKDYKLYYLGSFDSEEAAAVAYNTAAIEMFGEFANPNVIVATRSSAALDNEVLEASKD